MATLPEYIGLPDIDKSYYSGDIDTYKKRMLDTLMIASITPREQVATQQLSLYRTIPAWGKFVEYLGAAGITPYGNGLERLQIAISNIIPLSETYQNEFGQSEIFSSLTNMMSGVRQEAIFLAGGLDRVRDKLDESGDFGKSINKMGTDFANMVQDTASSVFGAEGGKQVRDIISNPNRKIDFPMMWKSSGYSAQYELAIRLHCSSPKNDDLYNTQIIAPLIALLQFVCPKSPDSVLYEWPFMMKFEIPGNVCLNTAYCSNLSVVKGGDTNDFSWISRPGIVDVRMTIGNVFNVMLNSKSEPANDGVPTLKREADHLLSTRKLKLPEPGDESSDAIIAGDNTATGSYGSYTPSEWRALSDEEKATFSQLENI